jgi:hypothetical protein
MKINKANRINNLYKSMILLAFLGLSGSAQGNPFGD